MNLFLIQTKKIFLTLEDNLFVLNPLKLKGLSFLFRDFPINTAIFEIENVEDIVIFQTFFSIVSETLKSLDIETEKPQLKIVNFLREDDENIIHPWSAKGCKGTWNYVLYRLIILDLNSKFSNLLEF